MHRQRRAEREHPPVLDLVAHLAPPADDSDTACVRARRVRWPAGGRSACGQIQTSVHAGGIASARMRASVAASFTGFPSGRTIDETLAALMTRQARLVVDDIAQAGRASRGHGVFERTDRLGGRGPVLGWLPYVSPYRPSVVSADTHPRETAGPQATWRGIPPGIASPVPNSRALCEDEPRGQLEAGCARMSC